jgi:methyl-accepting chemotaxis protein
MLPAFLADGELLSRHWIVVLAIGLVFFAVQLALTARFYSRVRGQQKVLRRLLRHYEQGSDGRGNAAATQQLSWIGWVLSIFPANTATPPGNYTREDVLHELDTRIASDSDYLLLQRMGVMAPLLGVVLTVAGFYWLDVSDNEQSLQSILLAVTPLVSGVGTGAVLALINQGLLHVAGRSVESLRLTARTWFDAVIWSRIGLDTQAATVKAVRALERFAVSMNDSSDRYAATTHQIEKSSASMTDAARQFREVVHSFGGEMKGIPQALGDVRLAAGASAVALQDLIQIGKRAVANLDVSVAAFRTTLEREFATAAGLHFRSSNVFAESVQQISDATSLLKEGADELRKTAQANTDSFEGLQESVRAHLLPGTREFHGAAQQLTSQIAASGKVAATLSSSAQAIAHEFDKVAGGLAPSVASFCDAVANQFGPAVTQQGTQVELVGRSLERIGEMAASMSSGATKLDTMLQEVSESVRETRKAHKQLADEAQSLAAVGRKLRETIESDVTPAQRTMHEIAASYADSAARLSAFMERGLGPATEQLATLHETLAGLEQVVQSIGRFSHARADIDRLTTTLAHAAEIGEAISSLPEKLQEVLEQSVHHAANRANSRGAFRAWLANRPK